MHYHINYISCVLLLGVGSLAMMGFSRHAPARGQGGRPQPAVISICTSPSQDITREKIDASFVLLNHLPERAVDLCQSEFVAQGYKIKVKRRGHSSDSYAKKQYQVDFLDEQGKGREVGLLGLPPYEEWALHGPYIDRSNMRNALAYTLGRQLGALRHDGAFAPHGRFVEVYVDSDYKGLYLLNEKIGRSSDLVDIPAVDLNRPEAVYPIFELTVHDPDLTSRQGTRLQYTYPSRKKLLAWQKDHPAAASRLLEQMIAPVNDFEERLLSDNFKDPMTGYQAVFDEGSFIDYFLVEEVFKQLDGFRSSMYFYKGRDQKLHIGPLWDFDTGAGNVCFLWGTQSTKGWVHKGITLYNKPVFWFKRLLKDERFATAMQRRYHELRQPGMPLHQAQLEATMQDLVDAMGDAPQRDQERWAGTHNLIQRTVTNTAEHGKNHAENTAILQQWLIKRMAWLDRHIDGV